MDKATGLISLPFHQLQYVPVLFADNTKYQLGVMRLPCGCVDVVAIMLIACISIVTRVIVEMLLVLFFICNVV